MCQGVITVLRSSFQLDQLDIWLAASLVVYCMTNMEQKDMQCCLLQLSLVLCVSRAICMHNYNAFNVCGTSKILANSLIFSGDVDSLQLQSNLVIIPAMFIQGLPMGFLGNGLF